MHYLLVLSVLTVTGAVQRPVAVGAPTDACSLSPASVLIGLDDDRPKYAFSDIPAGVRLGDGSILIVDRQADELRLFDRHGRFLKPFGRRGRGPGEFSDPIAIAMVSSDTVAVWDWDLQRISIFDLDGRLARTVTLTPPGPNPIGQIFTTRNPVSFLIPVEDVRPFAGKEYTQQFRQVLRYNMAGILLDTVITLKSGTRGWIDESKRMAGRPIFDAQAVFSAASGQLFFSDAVTPAVMSVEAQGGASRPAAKWSSTNRRVTSFETARWKRRQLEGVSDKWKPLVHRRNEIVPVASVFPTLDDLQIDSETGEIWVRLYTRPSWDRTKWLIFAGSGAELCTLELPKRARVLQVAARTALIRDKDDLDVQYVRVQQLVLGQSPLR